MSTNVNTIKRLLWVLIGVLILTYLISLNMENHLIVLDAKWISNDFLFAIAGGSFASIIVVVICELIRYRHLKLTTENAILVYLGNLYGQFLTIRSICKRAINNTDIVADNLIQPTCNNAIMVTDSIQGIDYSLLYNCNKIKILIDQFKSEKNLPIKSVLNNFAFLRIAIKEDGKILLAQGKQNLVTSACKNTNKVLNKVISQSTTILTYLDQIITQIDNEIGNKYQWQNKKQSLNAYQNNYIGQQLNDYIKEDVVVF